MDFMLNMADISNLEQLQNLNQDFTCPDSMFLKAPDLIRENKQKIILQAENNFSPVPDG